jgi:hypothetical protein
MQWGRGGSLGPAAGRARILLLLLPAPTVPALIGFNHPVACPPFASSVKITNAADEVGLHPPGLADSPHLPATAQHGQSITVVGMVPPLPLLTPLRCPPPSDSESMPVV